MNTWPGVHTDEYLAQSSHRRILGLEFTQMNTWPGVHTDEYLARSSHR